MATSYRIKVNLDNKSFTVGSGTATGTGATVIPADRGPIAPVKLNKGETERIRMLFGANRYEVLEAIAYNNKYPLWISAPHSGGAFGAFLLTDAGLRPCPISFGGDPDTINFTKLWLQFQAGISDGATGAWALTFDYHLLPPPPPAGTAGYIPSGMAVIGDKTYDMALIWNSAINGYGLNAPGLGHGTATVADPDTVLVQFEFDTGKVPPKGTPIAARFTTDTSSLEEKVYAIIGMKFPSDDFMSAAVYKSEYEGNLILDLQYKKKGAYYQQSGYPLEFSLVPGTQNGSGALIYALELLRDDDFVFVLPNTETPMDRDVRTGGSNNLSDFKGGFRGAKCTGQLLADGWEHFKEFKKYPADI
jgi:hypothetical protein